MREEERTSLGEQFISSGMMGLSSLGSGTAGQSFTGYLLQLSGKQDKILEERNKKPKIWV